MAMSEEQKRLRRWFQSHGWHTADNNGLGAYLESPIESCAGSVYYDKDPKTGQMREFCWERAMDIDINGLAYNYITFSIYERRHWWIRDLSVEKNGPGYTWVPSDDFEDWKRQPDASINIPTRDILKLAELIVEVQKDECRYRKIPYKPSLFASVKKSICRWIGVNTSREKIAWTYSNERLRQERENMS